MFGSHIYAELKSKSIVRRLIHIGSQYWFLWFPPHQFRKFIVDKTTHESPLLMRLMVLGLNEGAVIEVADILKSRNIFIVRCGRVLLALRHEELSHMSLKPWGASSDKTI